MKKHKTDSSAKLVKWIFLVCFAMVLPSCKKPFDVNVKAEDPIKVDLSMDVHVYQHGGGGAAVKKKSSEKANAGTNAYTKVLDSRRNRMAEVQTLKNNGFVGESRVGLLELRKIPDGDYGEYVKDTVREENSDRSFLIEYESDTKGKDIKEIQVEQWKHAQRKSHPGELIQTEDPDNPGKYIWVEKKSPAGSPELPSDPKEEKEKDQ